jgi:hypothetical protein
LVYDGASSDRDDDDAGDQGDGRPGLAWLKRRPARRSAYRAKASAICTTLKRWTPPSNGTLAQRFAATVDEAASVRNALSKLQPPPSLARLHARMLAL